MTQDVSPFGLGRRLVGLLLIALAAIPAWLVLDPGDFLQNMMRDAGRHYYVRSWGGGAFAIAVAVVLAYVTKGRVQAFFGRVGAALERPPRAVFAVGVGLLAAALTIVVSQVFFDGRTILNDASVQLIQARYYAAGELSGPVLEHPEFWAIQFMVLTAEGWVSQYPPMHAAVLALGFLAGAPWIAMAALMFVMGAAVSASFERLLPDRIGVARGAALLTAVSPLLLGLAAGYMNHATVAAFAALALWFALRADEGSVWWALAAGAAMGAAVTTRPVTGLLLGLALTVVVWWSSERRTREWMLPRVVAWVVGGAPFAAGLAWLNARFFGSPTTLGYIAASGPNHGLGFHEDPWGRMYGPAQAIGHTSAELSALPADLLGLPFPLVAAVGLFLLLVRRLERGERFLVAWALLPVAASALYWHHDLVFGPRMLGEAVPAWCALFVLAMVALTRRGGGGWTSETVACTALLATGFGLAWGGWQQISLHTRGLGAYPEVERDRPSLVFVHEPWADRVGARLSARGMRLDSVRTLLTRYNPCQLEAAFLGRSMDTMNEICTRAAASDSLAELGITGLLWLDDLPGIPGEGAMWVRDLGPERNRVLIEAYPDREPRFLKGPATSTGGSWDVIPYEEGMRLLWGGPVDSPTGSVPPPEGGPGG